MDKSPAHHLDEITSSLSIDELTPFPSINGSDYIQTTTELQIQVQPFLYDPNIPQNIYRQQQQQQFTMHYSPTQSLYPLDMTQLWPTQSQQQSYLAMTSSSLPEGTMQTTLSVTSSSPTRREYVPLAKRPSVASSTHSNPSDNESPTSSTREIRRERRRAQNRAAQRAFRARKEVPTIPPLLFPLPPHLSNPPRQETIKESSTRLSALRDELTSLQFNNETLSSTVSTLRARINTLQRENTQLRRSSDSWAEFELDAESGEFVPSALQSEESQGSSNSRTQIGSLEGGSDDDDGASGSRG
jgi:FtsZ-binding cell division protein ZapB